MITDGHRRTILQYLLLERMLPYDDFLDMVSRVVGDADFSTNALVESLNERIRRFSQKIIMTNSESTGDKLVVLASTADCAEIKGALTKDQMDFFYHLMDEIISNSGCITFIHALNHAPRSTSGRITMGEGEKVLQSFVKKKLLVLENGHIFLSPLTIIELNSYIVDTYNPPHCILCKKIRVAGGTCNNCDAALHSPCCVQYVKNSKGKARCPQCKGEWLPPTSQQ